MRRPLFIACLCLVIALTIGRILTGADTGDSGALPPDGSPVRITGRIDTRTSEAIILESISIIQNNQTYSYSGKLQCELTNAENTEGKDNDLKIGQRVVLEGMFVCFSSASNPGEFDAGKYYAAKGIGGRVRKAQLLAVGEDYSFLRETLYCFRRVLHDRLAQVFPSKEASIMQTILLGEKEELDADVKALYQKNGIAHILSISGLHITLLGMGLYRLLKRLGVPVKIAAVECAAALAMYGMMTGMSVSASRAVGMYLLQMFSVIVGRTYDMLTGVGLMALLLFLQEPQRLGDISFLMSFGAVLGICILTPMFGENGRESDAGAELEAVGISGIKENLRQGEKRDFGRKRGLVTMTESGELLDFDEARESRWNHFRAPTWFRTVTGILGDSAYERNKYRKGWRKAAYEGAHCLISALRSGFAASGGVILFTLPIQLWFFYEIPVYSVLLNLLVLPFMSAVMAVGIVSLIPGLGIVGTVDCLILWWYEWICNRFGELRGAIWCVGRPAVWQIIIYYIVTFLLIFGRKYVDKWKRRGAYEVGSDRVTGQRPERDRRCRKMRGVDNSVRFRNKEKEPYSETHSGICSAARETVFKNCRYLRQEILHGNRFLSRIVTVIMLVLSVGLLTGKFDRGSLVTFLDVGQGDGIVVETAQGAYLFDCGSTSRKKIGEYVLKPYLKSRGISSLRGVFVSHPDEDHMNGILELLENGGEWGIAVEQLFLPAIREADREEAFADLLAAARAAGVPVNYIKCGDEIRDRGLRLLCLHPEENTTLSDANAYSECFYVEIFKETVKWGTAADNREVHGESGSIAAGVFCEGTGSGDIGERRDSGRDVGKLSILLTGDVEGEGEQQLTQELQKLCGSQDLCEVKQVRESQKSQGMREAWELHGQEGLGVDILKVAHHGSGYSTSSDFLTAVRPNIAIISCGRNNSYGHPHEETLQRLGDAGVSWYCTTDYGALTVIVDGHGNRLRGYLNRK